jgi:hypothetical protein
MKLTASEVAAKFTYCDESGVLTRVIDCGRWKKDEQAGCLNTDGYIIVNIDRTRYYAHRLIWLMKFGEWPSGEIDHIDGNRSNNRIENLRCVTKSGNMRNQKRNSRNNSGIPGVGWDRSRNKWRVQIYVKGKNSFQGRFDSKEEAENHAKIIYMRNGYSIRHVSGATQ